MLQSYLIAVILLFRPMINKKLEDKTCGDGPSLAVVFEDDIELMDVHQEIQVSDMKRIYMYSQSFKWGII